MRRPPQRPPCNTYYIICNMVLREDAAGVGVWRYMALHDAMSHQVTLRSATFCEVMDNAPPQNIPPSFIATPHRPVPSRPLRRGTRAAPGTGESALRPPFQHATPLRPPTDLLSATDRPPGNDGSTALQHRISVRISVRSVGSATDQIQINVRSVSDWR